MIRLIAFLGTIVLAAIPRVVPAGEGSLAAQALPDLPSVRGEVSFDGHGTLGDFTGRTTRVTGRLLGAGTIEGVRGWVEAEAATLVTGNGRRDKDMRSSLEASRFPTLRFELDAVAAGPPSGDSLPVTLRGRFTLHGVTRESAVRGWALIEPARVTFRGQTPLTLTDYAIGGLSKALGLLKMNREIVVRMNLVFEDAGRDGE